MKTARIFALAGLTIFILSCQTPPLPSEVEHAREQENNLWRAGAAVYAPEEYTQYLASLRLAKDMFIKEKAKFGWFRNYKEVEAGFQEVLTRGQALLQSVEEKKALKSRTLSEQLETLRERIQRIWKLILTVNETQVVRRSLARAEVAMMESEALLGKEKYAEISRKIAVIQFHLGQAEEAVFSILARYAEEAQVETWRRWAMETIAESRKKGATAILITKLDRTLTVYRGGKVAAVYNIGLGKYGLSDKLYAGDEATPEGRYKVIKKIPQSRFHKALLIDYPNDEDKKEFSQAKKKGLIPPQAGIGGLIEIHGGGEDSLTGGCVAVEDSVMDKLFNEVSIGTPVTIIGSTESVAELLASLK
ncbi:MAG: L,D-transpeptidase [Clostridiales bacterium]|nr:L,D-transpeptidase [Clostridiales bacterium]